MPWNKWLYVQQKGYTKDEVLLIALDSGIDVAPRTFGMYEQGHVYWIIDFSVSHKVFQTLNNRQSECIEKWIDKGKKTKKWIV